MQTGILPTLMLVATALAGFGAGAALADQQAAAPVGFTSDDLQLCRTATTEAATGSSDAEMARFVRLQVRFAAYTPGETIEARAYRTRMLRLNLSFTEVRQIADACAVALERGTAFANPFAQKSDAAAFARFLREGDGRPHFEPFTINDVNLCVAATTVMWSVIEGDRHYNKASWTLRERYYEGLERSNARAKMLKAYLPEAEVRRIADACIGSMVTGAAFRNPLGSKGGDGDYYRWLAANPLPAEAGAGETAPATSPAVLAQRCDGTLERARDKATGDFRNAQKGVETWIRTGVAYGFDYIQYGCAAIDSGLSELRSQGCPAGHVAALQGFRNQYFIGLPSGSRLQCN